MKIQIGVVLLACLWTVPCLAQLDDEDQAHLEGVFAQFDFDKDGAITRAELEEEERRYDKLLEDPEFDFENDTRYEYYLDLESFLTADGNDDLQLDREEYASYLATRWELDVRPSLKDCRTLAEYYQGGEAWEFTCYGVDTDEDLVLSKQELAALYPEDVVAALLASIDSDGDQAISEAEWVESAYKERVKTTYLGY